MISWLGVILLSVMLALYSLSIKLASREYLQEKNDFFLFSVVLNSFQVLVLLALPPFRAFAFTWDSLIFGVVIGLGGLINVFFTVLAISSGPLSLTNSLISLNMTIPILYGLFFWGESLRPLDIIGFFLFMISILIISRSSYTEKEQVKKIELKWLVFVIASFASSGMTMVVSKEYALRYPSSTDEYIFIYMVANVVFSAMIYLFINKRESIKMAVKLLCKKNYILFGFCAGVTLALVNILFMDFVSAFDSVFFFPATRAVSIILVLVFSRLIFKERLHKKTLVGFIFSVLAIVLVSIGD